MANLSRALPTLLPVLLSLESSHAQGDTINVCGRTYQDAEDGCGTNPSCADLRCPNEYWKEDEFLMSCFAVPASKCNFGPPGPAMPAQYAEADLVDNTNYCGPIRGGWQIAVDSCSIRTACPSGSPGECDEGWTCYGGVVCDLSSKANTDAPNLGSDALPAPEPLANGDTPIDAGELISFDIKDKTYANTPEAPETTTEEPADGVLALIIASVETNDPSSSTTSTISATATTTTKTEAAETTTKAPKTDSFPFDADQLGFDPYNTRYCGPKGEGGWDIAVQYCNELTACPSGSPDECTDGWTCYDGVRCSSATGGDVAEGLAEVAVDPEAYLDETLPSAAFEATSTSVEAETHAGTADAPDMATANFNVDLSYLTGVQATGGGAAEGLAEVAVEPEAYTVETPPSSAFEAASVSVEAETDAGTNNAPDLSTANFGGEPDFDLSYLTGAREQAAEDAELLNLDTSVKMEPISATEIIHMDGPPTTTTFATTTTITEAPETTTTTDWPYTYDGSAGDCIADGDEVTMPLYKEPPYSQEQNDVSVLIGYCCSGKVENNHCMSSTGMDENGKQWYQGSCSGVCGAPDGEAAGSAAVSLLTDDLTAETVNDKSYCGPAGPRGWTRAATACSRSTACGAGGACPGGQVCYGGISCTNGAGGVPSPTDSSSTTATSTTTTTTASAEEPVDPESEILGSRYYCGPDSTVDHNAWFTALRKCSPETACTASGECPEGQICYGGIDCLAKPVEPAENEVEESVIVNGSANDVGSLAAIVESATITENPTTAGPTEEKTTSTTTTTTEIDTSEAIIDVPQSNEQTPNWPGVEANMYCGPGPKQNGDGWMTALANCSPQTACGSGNPCRGGQFCYAGLDCALKDLFLPEDQKPASGADDAEESTIDEPKPQQVVFEDITLEASSADNAREGTTTTTATSAITSSAATQQIAIDADQADDPEEEDVDDEENTFYCGPRGEGGWFKAAEICEPCSSGYPNSCGVGMTCYAGVTCSKPKLAADEMLARAEGDRAHIGYCGRDYYEAQDNCASRRPCKLSDDCDQRNPTCFPVTCDAVEGASGGHRAQHQARQDAVPAAAAASEGGPNVVVVGSFCGSNFDEAGARCATRAPCEEAAHCEPHEGCFSGVSCEFVEGSPELEAFRGGAGVAADGPTAEYDGAARSNLRRPGLASADYGARGSAAALPFASCKGVAIVVSVVAALLI